MGPKKCVSQDLTGLQTAGTLGTREFKGRDWAGLRVIMAMPLESLATGRFLSHALRPSAGLFLC